MKKRSERIKLAREDQRYFLTKQIRQEVTKGLVAATLAVGLGGYISQASQVLADELATTTKRFHQNDFINELAKPAMEIAKKNDLYSSVMIAQAALESGWGKSTLSKAPYYNLFGIKGEYQGQSVNFNTLEDSGGENYYQIKAGFRKYPNYDASLQDYADLLTGQNDPSNWRYNFYKGARRSNASSYQEATNWLTGRYATDTGYARKLNAIIEANQLTQFDGEFDGSLVETNETPQKKPQTVASDIVVRAGDGFYAIAKRYGVSVTDLLKVNGMSIHTIIHPGQVLKLPQSKELVQSEVSSNINQSIQSRVALVQPGDGFYAIAKRYGVSVSDLLKVNGMNTHTIIHPNQILKLPGHVSENRSVAHKEEVQSVIKTQRQTSVATVKAGDGFYAVANRYGVSVNDLLKANGMNIHTIIHPNQVLKLPGQSSIAHSNAPEQAIKSETALNSQGVKSEETLQLSPQASVQQADGAVVKAGDGFYAIARRYGVTVQDLLKTNGLTIHAVIHPGQVLKLPGQKESSSTPTQKVEVNGPVASQSTRVEPTVAQAVQSESAPSVSSTEETVVVQAGQGLWRIAFNHGMTLDELKDLNGLTTNLIHPGQVLKVK